MIRNFIYLCGLKMKKGMSQYNESNERQQEIKFTEAMRQRLLQLSGLNAFYGGGHEFCPADSVEQHFIPDL